MIVLDVLHAHVRPGNYAPAQRYLADGHWTRRTYADLDRLAQRISTTLLHRGLRRGDRIALLLATRADWTAIDIATTRIGCTLVPLYPTSSPTQVTAALQASTARVLITDQTQAQRLTSLPVDVIRVGDRDGDLLDLLRPSNQQAARATTVGPEDLFTILFSSGSTGAPKGCPLTHANYASAVTMTLRAERHPHHGHTHRQRVFLYLPLAHASARLHQLCTLAAGGELIYGAGTSSQILRQVRTTSPSYLPSVPRFFERAYEEAERPEQLMDALGGRITYALSGGAPATPTLIDAYQRADVPLVEGYGMSETSTVVAVGTPHAHRTGTVGRPIPGVTVRITGDNEITVRGPNVFHGYLDGTPVAEFDNGWYKTGDLGHLDNDGFLTVTGRKKNLIVTSTGKNIAPEPWENRLRQITGVDAAILLGDARPYLVALVIPDPAHPFAIDDVLARVRAVNKDLSPPESVRSLIVLTRALDPSLGEITASNKIARGVITQTLGGLIDSAYTKTSSPDGHVVEVMPQPPSPAAPSPALPRT